jgi:hypothetical protein
MKYIVWLLSSINIYFGATCLLNVLHILNDSKYSQGATVVFAIVFLCMGVGGFYYSIHNHQYKIAMLISIGPWIISLLFLLINMLFGNYQ